MFLVSRTHYIPFRDVKRGYRTVESDNYQQEENDVTVEIVENEQDYIMIVERQEKARWDSLMEETKKAQVLPSTRKKTARRRFKFTLAKCGILIGAVGAHRRNLLSLHAYHFKTMKFSAGNESFENTQLGIVSWNQKEREKWHRIRMDGWIC
jgi:hypothetical protein